MTSTVNRSKQPPIEIIPISHPLNATIQLPGSKSLTNRSLLIAALAEGTTTIHNALFSDDSSFFAEALAKLGFEIRSDESSGTYVVHGLGGDIPARNADLFIGNAGTAARFLAAMLTLGNGMFSLDGDVRMRQRPIQDLLDALTQLGAEITSPSGRLPLWVKASGLAGGKAIVSGEVSSQFLSGLLMSAPYAKSPVEITVVNGLNSKPYIDMTIAVMTDFEVNVIREGYERFLIPSSHYQPRESYTIEPDASAASYFFAAPAILGGTVKVNHIDMHSKQGDIAFVNILQQMGCQVHTGSGFIEVTGPEELKGIDVDMQDFSDTAQTLAAIAPFAISPTTIRGVGFIRAKETDRLSAVCTELRRLGVTVQAHEDGLTIIPAESFRSACIHTYNDHRMAMSFSLIGLRVPGIRIENPACVSKTFPNYFEVLEGLR